MIHRYSPLAALFCAMMGFFLPTSWLARAEISAPCDYSKAPVLDLSQILEEAVAHHEAVIRLPAGIYRIPPRGVALCGAKGLTIEGPETTLVFTQFKDAGMRFADCDGITVKGITFDYDPLPFTQGTIVATFPDHSAVDVEIQEGYPDLGEELNSSRIHLFDGQTRGWKRGAAEGIYRSLQRITPRKAKVLLDPSMVEKGQAALLRPGDMAVFSMRQAPALDFFRTQNIRLEALRIFSSPGLAMVIRNSAGENQFLRCVVERGPRPAGAAVARLLSTNADALNFAYSRKGPLIEGCEFSFMGDDGINLHGPAFQIVHVESPDVIWCLRRTTLDIIRPYYDNILLPGDPVRILAADNYRIKNTVEIARLETDLTPPFSLSRSEIVKAGPLITYPREKYLRITLSSDSGAAAGDVIDFPSANSAGYVVRKNTIHDVRPRAIRIMAGHGIIEDNYIARTTQSGISLAALYAYYREAGWIDHVTVRDNVLEDIGLGAAMNLGLCPTPGAISVSAETALNAPTGTQTTGNHRDIDITGNWIEGCTDEGIVVNGLIGGRISGNSISHCNTAYPKAPLGSGKFSRGHAITVINSYDVIVKNNFISGGTESDPVFIDNPSPNTPPFHSK